MSEIEIAKGSLTDSAKFRLLVSEPVTPDDLRSIGNLLHMAATKLEEEKRDEVDEHL